MDSLASDYGINEPITWNDQRLLGKSIGKWRTDLTVYGRSFRDNKQQKVQFP